MDDIDCHAESTRSWSDVDNNLIRLPNFSIQWQKYELCLGR